MLTAQENEFLSQVGPGTPGGELFRRYWLPFAVAQELTDERPTKFVRLLGEDLVLFRDKSGRVGLLADHCSHRGASLLYGRVEERGIACAYHGWLYDVQGSCLETPAEPAGSLSHLTVKQRAYPVRQFLGLYWVYMGPAPVPELTKYDLWSRRDGTHRLTVHPQLDCSWLQAMENAVDAAHLLILHLNTSNRGRTPPSTTRGFIDDIKEFHYFETPYGIMKKRVHQDGMIDENPILFPYIQRTQNNMQIRVPIDDTHTWIVAITFEPSADGSVVEQAEDAIPVRYAGPYKQPPTAIHPEAVYEMNREVLAQDHMAWETQGAIADRTAEHLATSDHGIVMFRQMLRREIEKVQLGIDPIMVMRDSDHEVVDTRLDTELTKLRTTQVPRAVAASG